MNDTGRTTAATSSVCNRNPTMTATISNAPQGPQTAAERDFAGLMLSYYRQAGERAAWALYKRMADASEAGCYREDHSRMVRVALDLLPTRH